MPKPDHKGKGKIGKYEISLYGLDKHSYNHYSPQC